MEYFEKAVSRLSGWLDRIAQVAIAAMMLVACANIIGRIFGHPIVGTYEFVTFLGMLLSFALAYCAVKKGHIFISLVLERLSPRNQGIINSITGILGMGIFAIATWQLAVLATDKWQSGAVSPTMGFPVFILIYASAFSCLILFFVLLGHFIRALWEAIGR